MRYEIYIEFLKTGINEDRILECSRKFQKQIDIICHILNPNQSLWEFTNKHANMDTHYSLLKVKAEF